MFAVAVVLLFSGTLLWLGGGVVAYILGERHAGAPTVTRVRAERVSVAGLAMAILAIVSSLVGVYFGDDESSDIAEVAPTGATTSTEVTYTVDPVVELYQWATVTDAGSIAVVNTRASITQLERCADGNYWDEGWLGHILQVSNVLDPEARKGKPKAPPSELQEQWLLGADNAYRALRWCGSEFSRFTSMYDNDNDPEAALRAFLINFGVPEDEVEPIDDTIASLKLSLAELGLG